MLHNLFVTLKIVGILNVVSRNASSKVRRVHEFVPLAKGEVRLRQDAVGVNYVDTMVRDGRFAMPLPLVLGFKGAGVVTSVGPGVTDRSIGDRVGYFFSAGGYAPERATTAESLIAVPHDITTEQAATFLSKGLTAWMGLRALHQLGRSEVVLVQGASGGVGSSLVPLGQDTRRNRHRRRRVGRQAGEGAGWRSPCSSFFAAIRARIFADLVVVRYPLADAAQVHRDLGARSLAGLPILIP